MSARGRFITLEGGEGVGKSTLLRGLAEALERRGLEVVRTREPGGTPAADEIRALLVRGERERWSSMAELLLFAAARTDHLERLIRPALQRGAWVLCDRYVDSTRAYQSAAGGISREAVELVHALIKAETPDLTLVLDLDAERGLQRSRGEALGETRFEAKGHAFHAAVRGSFLAIAKAEPARCAVLDASKAPDQVLAEALTVLDNRLS